MVVPKVGFPRVPQDHGALDGAKHVSLLSSPAADEHCSRGESRDRVRLMLPTRSPAEASRKCDRRALRTHGTQALPKMFDRVQVSRHWGLQGAACHHSFHGAPPMTQSLASTRQADAPLVHVQRLGAEF